MKNLFKKILWCLIVTGFNTLAKSQSIYENSIILIHIVSVSF